MSVVRTIADQFAEVSKVRGLLRERGHRIRSEFASTINLVSVPAVRTESPDDKTALNEFVELRHAHVVLAMPDRDKLVVAAEYLCSIGWVVNPSRLDRMKIYLIISAELCPSKPSAAVYWDCSPKSL